MGVVDAQGVRHLGAPTLGEQGEGTATVSGMQAAGAVQSSAHFCIACPECTLRLN
jgi:hypothetical protein